ncbi:uncharacterized protein LOC144648151 [Oculina patagonica]
MGQQLSNLRSQRRQITDLQRQLREKDQTITNLRNQSRVEDLQITALNIEVATRDQQVAHLQKQTNSRDWVINLNEISLMRDERLGKGAWGSVYQGKFRRCNVAVKQIHNEVLNRAYFEREVGIASRCRHPCLLQFIGATNDQRPLIVTELMEGSLRSLYEERPLTEREISVFSLDVAQALNYLHLFNPNPIIHRDISSANVLLWRQGDQWRGKVSDYGTANFVRQCTRDDPGAVIYCAPETLSVAQNQIISCKVDVYSFGVLLCEMCIRELPDPQRRDEQVRRVANQRLLRRLITPCLQATPGSRPDMDEIITELEN